MFTPKRYADVAELADALDSGSSECKFMWVQVPSSAPRNREQHTLLSISLCDDGGLNGRHDRKENMPVACF